MPRAKHRRHSKSRSRDRNQRTAGVGFSPTLIDELALVRDFLRTGHGDRQPSQAELEDALLALSGRLPLIARLLHELDHNDPDGTLAQVLLAVADA
jgi:hypothetical protein